MDTLKNAIWGEIYTAQTNSMLKVYTRLFYSAGMFGAPYEESPCPLSISGAASMIHWALSVHSAPVVPAGK